LGSACFLVRSLISPHEFMEQAIFFHDMLNHRLVHKLLEFLQHFTHMMGAGEDCFISVLIC